MAIDSGILFQADDLWHDYCNIYGIEDPWELINKIKNEYTHKTVDKYTWSIEYGQPNEDQIKRLKEAEKYRDQYIENREIWKANYIFKNFGYDALISFAQTHPFEKTALSRSVEQVYPCEGAYGQCNFACPVFHNCSYSKKVRNP